MQFAVYVDLTRELTIEERSAIGEALDATVSEGGCVGLQNGPNDEVYFAVEAATEKEAAEQAKRYMDILLQAAAIDVEYELTLQSTNLSLIEKSLLLAAFFRGNTLDQGDWTSSSDQVVTLSLFYTGDITSDECQSRFSTRSYVGGLYDDDGELRPQIEARYQRLIELIWKQPQLIEGGGDLETPAYPSFTACRLTTQGIELIPDIVDRLPRKPDFPNWPDRRSHPSVI